MCAICCLECVALGVIESSRETLTHAKHVACARLQVYMVFECMVLDVDLLLLVYEVPTVGICRGEQRMKALAQLGIPAECLAKADWVRQEQAKAAAGRLTSGGGGGGAQGSRKNRSGGGSGNVRSAAAAASRGGGGVSRDGVGGIADASGRAYGERGQAVGREEGLPEYQRSGELAAPDVPTGGMTIQGDRAGSSDPLQNVLDTLPPEYQGGMMLLRGPPTGSGAVAVPPELLAAGGSSGGGAGGVGGSGAGMHMRRTGSFQALQGAAGGANGGGDDWRSHAVGGGGGGGGVLTAAGSSGATGRMAGQLPAAGGSGAVQQQQGGLQHPQQSVAWWMDGGSAGGGLGSAGAVPGGGASYGISEVQEMILQVYESQRFTRRLTQLDMQVRGCAIVVHNIGSAAAAGSRVKCLCSGYHTGACACSMHLTATMRRVRCAACCCVAMSLTACRLRRSCMKQTTTDGDDDNDVLTLCRRCCPRLASLRAA